MQFDKIDRNYQTQRLRDICEIIRKGIEIAQPRLKKDIKERNKNQILAEQFCIIGTADSQKWIGASQEYVGDDKHSNEDIYFYLNDDNHTPIFFVECKRLPQARTKDQDEYVCAKSTTGAPCGAIERYKLEQHGTKDIRYNGIIAYIENKTVGEWKNIINQKIENIYPEDSVLEEVNAGKHEFNSYHKYINSVDEDFLMHHFWIILN